MLSNYTTTLPSENIPLSVFHHTIDVDFYVGDSLSVLKQLPDQSVQCCVTSPPYWGLRDYGVPGQIGLEETPEQYVAKMVELFREVRRVLKDNGIAWVNLGDSYAGSNGNGYKQSIHTANATNGGGENEDLRKRIGRDDSGFKPKDLIGIPWRVAFALQADGWYLRSDIIWHKPNPMPESVTDRPTKSHEYIFLLAKSERYYYDHEAIKEQNEWPDHNRFGNKDAAARLRDTLTGNMREDAPEFTDRVGRNKRSVWTVTTQPFSEAHFATFPPDLIKPCILAGCPEGGIVLDPFGGAGTTALVSRQLNRKSIYIDLNPKYAEMAIKRLEGQALPLPMHFETVSQMGMEEI